ncbi:MAG: N-acetyl-gamma-glutamyl-phosphate reductase [Candidatus Dormibacteria bacterium]
MPTAAGFRVAIAGATGYIGIQCVDLVAGHPNLEVARVLGRSSAGRRYGDVVPGSSLDLVVEDDMNARDADIVLSAMPHTVAADHARQWLSSGAIVVDMSADFRLRDTAAHDRWYGGHHPASDLCDEAVYGLVELHREKLATADLIAAPGCYPTASLLATVPALAAGLVEPDLVVDAKSGVSGAGRSPALTSSFSEVNESVRAYGVGGHRHKAEMEEQLAVAAGTDVRVTFVPHLIPMTRGILATAYLRPRPAVSAADVEEPYRAFCAANPCLRLSAEPPSTKSVAGTNTAAINVTVQDGMAVVTVAIDNLIKGAAGQGIQALNIRLGLDETAGLSLDARWP